MWNGKPKISIIVPVFNEEESLSLLHDRLTRVLGGLGDPYEVIFVDDGSHDGSFARLRAISDSDPAVQVVRLRRNFGQTAALMAGFDQAHGEVLITIDADLQNDPTDIPMLLTKLDEGYDIVSGWRKQRKDPLLTKALPSMLSNKLASWLTGVHLHDYGCTLKAYRREVIDEIHLYGELHRYIPAVASSVGARVAEIEVQHQPRSYGNSKYGAGRLVRGMLDILTVKLLLTYMNRPMQMFAVLGLLLIVAGALAATVTVLMKAVMGIDMTGNPFLYLAILAFITAIQFLSLGFLGEISVRTYHETQKKPIYVIQEVLAGEREAAGVSTR